MDYDRLYSARLRLADMYTQAPAHYVNRRRMDVLLYLYKHAVLRTALQRRA